MPFDRCNRKKQKYKINQTDDDGISVATRMMRCKYCGRRYMRAGENFIRYEHFFSHLFRHIRIGYVQLNRSLEHFNSSHFFPTLKQGRMKMSHEMESEERDKNFTSSTRRTKTFPRALSFFT